MASELAWYDVLTEGKQQPYFLNTLRAVASGRQPGVTIYPPQRDVFNTFRFAELGDVRMVILGQDPYHGPGRAHGLASSVHPGIATSPSLLNMYKELKNTIPGFTRPNHGHPENWACRGVLLLSTVLTVHAGQAHPYASLGWETFTDKVVSLVNRHHEGVVFLLWRPHAQKKGATIDEQCHHVPRAPRPLPLSTYRGFFSYNRFVLVDRWLGQRGKTPADQMPVLPTESE